MLREGWWSVGRRLDLSMGVVVVQNKRTVRHPQGARWREKRGFGVSSVWMRGVGCGNEPTGRDEGYRRRVSST